ncbi:hypothetical protein EVB94_012 [Rhizobium phage RHph_TM40]|nr:hypothetical protein EVB94_012 [Rhizobium phage RHph_TM40]QIG72208.1 hypothetical protein EVB96_012 [Rhizobium phage RHph_TM3_3_6]
MINKIEIAEQESIEFKLEFDLAEVRKSNYVMVPISLARKIDAYFTEEFKRNPTFDPTTNTFK